MSSSVIPCIVNVYRSLLSARISSSSPSLLLLISVRIVSKMTHVFSKWTREYQPTYFKRSIKSRKFCTLSSISVGRAARLSSLMLTTGSTYSHKWKGTRE
uniref:Uncharacterized protein n=1 Tax=Cacopsylla melanoneura TaxID=428564 RepID=A0A8D8SHG1_9HEMI